MYYIAHYGKAHDDNPPGRGSGEKKKQTYKDIEKEYKEAKPLYDSMNKKDRGLFIGEEYLTDKQTEEKEFFEYNNKNIIYAKTDKITKNEGGLNIK